MPDNNKLNVRNIYIDLLNKMKELDAVDQAYIDHLIALVRADMGLLDNDIAAIEALIPDNATASNKLSTITDIPIIEGSGYHNSIYRGKNLGSVITPVQWSAIQNGTFEDLYIGDYWEINSVRWQIAHFDYWLNTGDQNCTSHHVVIVPYNSLYTTKMNNSMVTTGGYYNSKMRGGSSYLDIDNSNLYDAKTMIDNAFGSSHILSHREYITNAVTDGNATGSSWYDSTIDLMSEVMICGTFVWSGGGKGYEVGTGKEQLALFRLDHSCIGIRESWWLRSVYSDTSFVGITVNGNVGSDLSNKTHGVRPCFAIYNPTT